MYTVNHLRLICMQIILGRFEVCSCNSRFGEIVLDVGALPHFFGLFHFMQLQFWFSELFLQKLLGGG